MKKLTEIALPASKSIANRAIIINELSYSPYPITNLSDCDDTQVLINIFNSNDTHFDIGAAGTAMRFLTAFLSKTLGEWHITGSARMKQRPIKILVDALNEIGAKITYTENEGYPPLQIFGSALQGGTIQLNGSVSSQYISALMMIAPYTQNGLSIELQGEIVSKSYIEMTAAMMRQFGVLVTLDYPNINIHPQNYTPIPFTVENDWSAASYWYQWVAVMQDRTIKLTHLQKNSLQGDSKIVEIFSRLGVNTTFRKESVEIAPNAHATDRFVYNFVNQPDIAQTVAVTCCLKSIPFKFTGLQTLKIKETDRIAALISELKKMGFVLQENAEGEVIWNGEKCEIYNNISIKTYDDHRMAMAFAVAQQKFDKLNIENPEVVTKSYPNFWEEYHKLVVNS